MLILIIETSTEKGVLILANGPQPAAIKPLPAGPALSKCLALEVKIILNGQVPELIAVGAGPGSYTGIRVGAALAKALAYGWRIPLLGFCSLAAFGPLPVLVDARMGGFYALFDSEPRLISPNEIQGIQKFPYIASPHPEIIKKRLTTPSILVEKEPDPDLLADLVYRQFLEKGAPPPELTYLSCP